MSQVALQMPEILVGSTYLAKPGTNQDFVLMHSTGHELDESGIDVPPVYVDYYCVEGLLRAWKMGAKQPKPKIESLIR